MAQLQAGPAMFPTRGKPCVWEPRGSERPVFIAERVANIGWWLQGIISPIHINQYIYIYIHVLLLLLLLISISTFFLVQRAVLATGCYQRAKIFTTDRGRPSLAGGNCGEQISLYAIHIFIRRYWIYWDDWRLLLGYIGDYWELGGYHRLWEF